ncbi:hypothetical protein B9Z55_024725 [Caenorhabditis nigoni]|uniref:Uncharacterized protein n=1 Tax=Caenorhabditis nigoni TaxID=1611254 RepID=A0A2G5SV93_9PELO|nr:hypothetical protein B9Z55_024725 [Caenorhabditis nigoni]
MEAGGEIVPHEGADAEIQVNGTDIVRSLSKVLRIPTVLEAVAKNITDPNTAIAFSYVFKGYGFKVMRAVKQENFALRIENRMMFNYPENWRWHVYLDSSAKPYGNGADIPIHVAKYVPFVIIESNYTHKGHSNTGRYYPNSTMDEDHLTLLNKCTNLKKLYIISVNVGDFTDEHFRDNKFQSLKELRLEGVHKHGSVDISGVKENNTPLIGRDLIAKLSLPSGVLGKFLSGGNMNNLQLVSLLLKQDSIDELVKHFENKKLENLEILHLEDIMIPEDQVDRADALMISIVKTNKQNMSLTLSIQNQTYGTSLLNVILNQGFKIRHLHLIINMQQTNIAFHRTITVLQSHCEEMTITFHKPYRRLRMPEMNFPDVCSEMEKWDKVTHMTLGKNYRPYAVNALRDDANDELYVKYIQTLAYLPNMKKFSIVDRVESDALKALSNEISYWNLDEITLALSHQLINDNMKTYNNLLRSIPENVKSIKLLFFPFNTESLEEISERDSLKKFTYFQHPRIYQSSNAIKNAMPNCIVDTRKWKTAISGCLKPNVISDFLINIPN